MAEGRVDSRVYLRKTLVTAAALAAACGAVVAMRWGVRAVVASSGLVAGSSAAPEAEPGYEPAPRQYSLAALVPADLRVNAGGIAVTRDVQILRMPCEQALEVSAAEAEAAGWEPFALPLTMEFANELQGGAVYLRPDRTIVCRSHVALKDGTTRREDMLLPLGDLAEIQRDLTLDEIVALRGDLIGRRLPSVLRDVIPGRLFYTQFTPHANGAGFLVIALSSFAEGMVRREAVQKLRASGWTRDEQNAPGVWRRGNLTALYDVRDRGDGLGTFVTVRFADDDVIMKRKENEK
jgi:hypothetical protein